MVREKIVLLGVLLFMLSMVYAGPVTCEGWSGPNRDCERPDGQWLFADWGNDPSYSPGYTRDQCEVICENAGASCAQWASDGTGKCACSNNEPRDTPGTFEIWSASCMIESCWPSYTCADGHSGNFIVQWSPSAPSCCVAENVYQEGYNCEGEVCATRTGSCNPDPNPWNFIVNWGPSSSSCLLGGIFTESGYNCAGSIVNTRTAQCTGTATCTPSCSGSVCGDDGCGGSCGSCSTGYACSSGSCNIVYGDGIIVGSEVCDDGNVVNGDGCSSVGALETGWVCVGAPSVCGEIHGDGIIVGGEQCDDGNVLNGDGCSSTGMNEPGWVCVGAPSVCGVTHGDGLIRGNEQCDDGNLNSGDGCFPNSTIEQGWTCVGEPSVCSFDAAVCGNGVLETGEECDDGNSVNNDGCSNLCQTYGSGGGGSSSRGRSSSVFQTLALGSGDEQQPRYVDTSTIDLGGREVSDVRGFGVLGWMMILVVVVFVLVVIVLVLRR